MINIETILSSFDDRGTLLKWLKAVEKALQDATLTSVDVITISTQQIQLKFNFEDGTSITTPTIMLPKGDKGDKGTAGTKIITTTDDFSQYEKGETFELNIEILGVDVNLNDLILGIDNFGLAMVIHQIGQHRFRLIYLGTIKGADGVSPTISIGLNGNWYVNGVDTGVKAQGETGASGISVTNVTVNASNHLIVTLSDNTQIDAGAINITIDSELNGTSTNPVQNKVIYNALQLKMENPMTSMGAIIYGGASGEPTSLPLGNAGEVLTVKDNLTGVEWKQAGAGSQLYKHFIKLGSLYDIEIITSDSTPFTSLTLSQFLYNCYSNNGIPYFKTSIQTSTNQLTKIVSVENIVGFNNGSYVKAKGRQWSSFVVNGTNIETTFSWFESSEQYVSSDTVITI